MSTSTEAQPQQQPGAWSLLSLVDELLLCVIDQIDSHKALCNLAATCKRFQNLVEPYCWRTLLVTKGSHASCIALALNSRVERIAYVQELAIRYDHHHEEGIENIGGFLQNMLKLRSLHIESPCPNNSDWRLGQPFQSWTRIDYTTLFETANLNMLHSFTLHGHPSESRKFALGRTAIIFFHPTLRSITISCLDFNADITLANISPEKHKSTPLQSLTLIECNVYVGFLDVVLSLPRALKELSIGERLHVFDTFPSNDPVDRTNHPLFLSALQRQADSLERLCHNAGHTSFLHRLQLTNDSCSAALRSMTKLRHLEVGFESSLLRYLERDGCPPALQILKVSDHAVASTMRRNYVSNFLKAVLDRVHHLVDIDFLYNYNQHVSVPDLWFEATSFPNRKHVYDVAKAVKARGKRLRLFGQKFEGGIPFIPPYMYGEDVPVEVLLYDSDHFYRFCGKSHHAYDEELLEKPELVENFVRMNLENQQDLAGIQDPNNT